MLFLQSVTKYADKLKQVDEPKVINPVVAYFCYAYSSLHVLVGVWFGLVY